MTTLRQTPFLFEILEGQPIPAGKLAYFRARLGNRLHAIVMSEFARLQEAEGLTKAELARRIGRDSAQINRWLSAPTNWTLQTLSDLLLAMKSEPCVSLSSLEHMSRSAAQPHFHVETEPFEASGERPMNDEVYAAAGPAQFSAYGTGD